MFRYELLIGAIAAVFALAPAAAAIEPGPQILTFVSDVDDTDQPYAVYVPRDFDAAGKYPLVVSLHAAHSNHLMNLRRVFGRRNLRTELDFEAAPGFPRWKDVGYIVASPLARGDMGYRGIAERDVYAMLRDIEHRFPIDRDRIYLTGVAEGGGGALWFGVTRPDLWAAIAVVCPEPSPGAMALAGNLLNVPVHFFHGDADPVVDIGVSRGWTSALRQLGSAAELTEYPGVRHNSWDLAYRDASIFDWFGRFKRNRHPDRVRFATSRYEYSSAYWLRIDELTTGGMAGIDARFVKPNRIEVTTRDLGAFTLALAGHPKFSAARPLHIVIDGKPVRARSAASLSFVRRNDVWSARKYVAAAGSKRAGGEGPISAALSARHLYIYGTTGSTSAEELARRRNQAERAAEWSNGRTRLPVTFQVLPDVEVTDSDIENANLILFGSKETNSLIARFSAGLPVELSPSAADYSLSYIYPEGKRYIVVNSGLPWWSGAAYANRTGERGAPSPFAVALTFQDFILFKGSLENVIAEGRFDEHWRLPPEAAAKMTATGAVKVK